MQNAGTTNHRIIDSDDDSDGRACCVILKTQTGMCWVV
jgi:hypothetical protein